jgi:hypothetical protein
MLASMRRPTSELRARLIWAAVREAKKKELHEFRLRRFRRKVRDQNSLVSPEMRTAFPTWLGTYIIDGDLNLLDAPKQTLAKLLQIETPELPKGTRVRLVVDLTGLESIDAASLLFLASRLRALSKRPWVDLCGRFPESGKALRTLIEADFTGYVLGLPRKPPDPHDRSVSLLQGFSAEERLVSGDIAERVQRFLLRRDARLAADREESDHVYAAVVECLENVRHHAYRKGVVEGRRQGWWAVGLYDDDTATATVAILDMGIGIAGSLGEKEPTRWTSLFKRPADLLDQATQGVRTETKEPKRGQGLKNLREFAAASTNRRLHVMSSSGMITCSAGNQTVKRTTEHFNGTIVCVQISQPEK